MEKPNIKISSTQIGQFVEINRVMQDGDALIRRWLMAIFGETNKYLVDLGDIIQPDEYWFRVRAFHSNLTELSQIARRFILIGASEAGVERLLSQQKDTQGRHMTNVGTKTIYSRLTLKTIPE